MQPVNCCLNASADQTIESPHQLQMWAFFMHVLCKIEKFFTGAKTMAAFAAIVFDALG